MGGQQHFPRLMGCRKRDYDFSLGGGKGVGM